MQIALKGHTHEVFVNGRFTVELDGLSLALLKELIDRDTRKSTEGDRHTLQRFVDNAKREG